MVLYWPKAYFAEEQVGLRRVRNTTNSNPEKVDKAERKSKNISNYFIDFQKDFLRLHYRHNITRTMMKYYGRRLTQLFQTIGESALYQQ